MKFCWYVNYCTLICLKDYNEWMQIYRVHLHIKLFWLLNWSHFVFLIVDWFCCSYFWIHWNYNLLHPKVHRFKKHRLCFILLYLSHCKSIQCLVLSFSYFLQNLWLMNFYWIEWSFIFMENLIINDSILDGLKVEVRFRLKGVSFVFFIWIPH